MAPIRVLIAEMPRVQSELFRKIFGSQEDIVTYGLRPVDEVGRVVGEFGADVVITDLVGSRLPSRYMELFDRYPGVKVLAIAREGRNAFAYELRPHKIALGELSPQNLREAVRNLVTGHSPVAGG